MKTVFLFPFFVLSIIFTNAQERVTFDDGTEMTLHGADYTYAEIRKFNFGPCLVLDGLMDFKVFQFHYLKPEKFYVSSSIGLTGVSAEGIVFFSGKTKEKKKKLILKSVPTGYKSYNSYALRTTVEKRKEVGAYLAISDYGTLYNGYKSSDDLTAADISTGSFTKLTTIYAGIATVNYWHTNMYVDDYQRRGQFRGKTLLAPFISLNGNFRTPDDSFAPVKSPLFGARFMYEISNTFGLLQMKGRTDLTLRMGADYIFKKPGIVSSSLQFLPIIGGGLTINLN
jgi:hypothetical protein